MRFSLLIVYLFCCVAGTVAQNALPLHTPYSWLREARSKAALKDTVGAFGAVLQAVRSGLFDERAVAGSKTFRELFSTGQMDSIARGIRHNRNQIEKPGSIRVVTEDISRFWTVYPFLQDSAAGALLLNEYILKGSTGLRTFFQIRMNGNLQRFVDRVRASASYYNSIKEASEQFKTLTPKFVDAASKLEAMYPPSIFPPIYFLIGHLNNVGTADGYAGLLIGTEHLCRHAFADTTHLSAVDKSVLFDSSLAVPLIVHEYVHFQQKNTPEQNLLDFSIMEGVADFLTYLITGKHTNPEVFRYGMENEAAIWKHFTNEMSADNLDNWLFNAYNPATGYPGNLGYFVGYRICERYYQRSANKKKAIRELLEIKDFNAFLEKSGYSRN